MSDYYSHVYPVEAGKNTSTIALQAVEGDEKEPGAWRYNWATLVLGLYARLMTLLRKKITVAKSRGVKTR
jgi:hypothetical protein